MKSKLFAIFCLLVILSPAIAFGADADPSSYWWFFVPEFKQLVGIPGVSLNDGAINQQNFGTYINALYRLSISLAALLAVIKIVAAGAKYMLTDIVPGKEAAKKDIQGALIGLLVIIGAVVILNTVNTDLTKNELMVTKLDMDSVAKYNQILAAIEEQLRDARRVCEETSGPNQCQLLVCENLLGINKFDVRAGEDETSACLRTCREDYKGAFIAHNAGDVTLGGSSGASIESGWKSATCTYDPAKAATCDPNNSWNCCAEIKKGIWYDEHDKCLGPTNTPFEEIGCSFVAGGGSGYNCTLARQRCTEAGRTIVSDPTKNSQTILCSVEGTFENDIDTRNELIGGLTGAITFNSELSRSQEIINNLLGFTTSDSVTILSETFIPMETMVAALGSSNIGSTFTDAVALSLQSKCTGSKVIPYIDNGENRVSFYCIE